MPGSSSPKTAPASTFDDSGDPHDAAPSTGSACLDALARRIAACRICRDSPHGRPLPHEPRPVVRPSARARVLVAGQAPGVRVHATGLPFNDPSGDRLRAWMQVTREVFYDTTRIAIVPMGFCFPGHDARNGDLPPRRECRLAWHDLMMEQMGRIETILAIGAHAHAYHLRRLGLPFEPGVSMTETARNWRIYAQTRPRVFVLPHPSWRNTAWLKKNPWFESEVLPELRLDLSQRLAEDGRKGAQAAL